MGWFVIESSFSFFSTAEKDMTGIPTEWRLSRALPWIPQALRHRHRRQHCQGRRGASGAVGRLAPKSNVRQLESSLDLLRLAACISWDGNLSISWDGNLSISWDGSVFIRWDGNLSTLHPIAQHLNLRLGPEAEAP